LIKYFTIDSNVKNLMSKLKRETGFTRFIAMGKPAKLMANAKVLEIRPSAMNFDYIIKIDGPGFLIDELYKTLS